MTQPIDRLIEVLATPPANFQWTASNGAIVGARAGIVITILPHKVEAQAVMAYDAPELARSNAMFFVLILMALRDWKTADQWLAQQMQRAHQSAYRSYASPHEQQRCCFSYDKLHSRATLMVRRS
jgi:hypothetical protein